MVNLNDVLLAMSNIPVDDPIAEIWGRGLQGGYKIIEYTGSLPITISANGDALIDYRIYGADGGVGAPTENLFDIREVNNPPKCTYSGNTFTLENQGMNYDIMCKTNGASATPLPEKMIAVSPGTYTIMFGNVTTTSDSRISVRFFDGETVAMPVNQARINSSIYYTFVTEKNGYISFLFNLGNITISDFMLVKGSTAPASYIPYGYKLPMTVYKQEFTVTNDMLNQSNWILSPPYGGYELRYFMYFDISASISKVKCDAKVYKNFTDGYVPEKLVVALTDGIYATVDTRYRILNNNGVILNKKFDFSSWDNIYLCIGYGEGIYSEAIKQLKIDELFENWKILIAPVSQTQTVPAYIGENKLDSVEGVADYVDKTSGKIVRMIGEYTFTGDESFNKYGNSDVFYTSKSIDPVGITTVNAITMRCDHPAFTAIENKDTRYWLNPEADDICCFLPGGMSQVFLRSTSNFTTAAECKAYLKAQYDNGTPVKISYWLKTPVKEDPPVSFPDIPTIDGTTVIDYDGEPKPSQMYIKCKGKAVQ